MSSQASHVLHTLATTASIIPCYCLLVVSLPFLLFVISSGDSESGNWITLRVGQSQPSVDEVSCLQKLL